jgi:hypothetical protein
MKRKRMKELEHVRVDDSSCPSPERALDTLPTEARLEDGRVTLPALGLTALRLIVTALRSHQEALQTMLQTGHRQRKGAAGSEEWGAFQEGLDHIECDLERTARLGETLGYFESFALASSESGLSPMQKGTSVTVTVQQDPKGEARHGDEYAVAATASYAGLARLRARPLAEKRSLRGHGSRTTDVERTANHERVRK